jgi:hypothetical protein
MSELTQRDEQAVERPADELGVLVFGGIGSGKTSLLAAMWDATRQRLNPAGFTVEPDLDDHYVLDEARENLVSSFVMKKGPYWRAVPATQFPAEMRLYVKRAAAAPISDGERLLTLRFTDTPGEYAERKLRALATKLAEARCGLLTVDCVEMMAGESEIAPPLRRNRPGVVARGIDEWLKRAPADHSLLLLVTFTKCETWQRERDVDGAPFDVTRGGEMLVAKFEATYKEMLNALSEHAQRVAVVLCPVQTVGNLTFFDYVEPEQAGGYPGELYAAIEGRATDAQAKRGYAPVDADQPLRHILNFALIDRIDKAFREIDVEIDEALADIPWYVRPLFEGRVEVWLRKTARNLEITFGESRDLMRTVSRFVRHTKRTPPFKVIQGEPLIARSSVLWDRVDEIFQ